MLRSTHVGALHSNYLGPYTITGVPTPPLKSLFCKRSKVVAGAGIEPAMIGL